MAERVRERQIRRAGQRPRQAGHFSTSLERGLAILSSFTRDAPLLGISELAGRLRMNGATVHRYVRTLEHLGYLTQDPATRRYRLATKVLELGLGKIDSTALREVAAPALRTLSERFGQTVSMALLDDLDIVYLERVVAPLALNVNLSVGSRLPAYCTSMGKALLAALGDDDLAERTRRISFERRGPNTIASRRALLKEIDRVRELGYAMNNEELEQGIRSVAAPVHTGSVRGVAAVNMAVQAARFTAAQLATKHAPAVVATAAAISRDLGYRADGRR